MRCICCPAELCDQYGWTTSRSLDEKLYNRVSGLLTERTRGIYDFFFLSRNLLSRRRLAPVCNVSSHNVDSSVRPVYIEHPNDQAQFV